MKYFTTETCIRYLEVCLERFSILKEIVNSSDWKYWNKILQVQNDIYPFLFGADVNFNFLNLTIATGFSIETGMEDPLFYHYRTVLSKVGEFLRLFPELKTNKKFKEKIKDIGGLSFLSTLSELTIAAQLKRQDFSIAFETKFKQAVSQKERDIDVSASHKNGTTFHIEVYMPNKKMGASGFFDPQEHIGIFKRSIKTKVFTKFGDTGISGLDGRFFLAINKAFFDMLYIKTILPSFSFDYEELITFCPRDVDGLIIFEDDFGSEHSFKFEKLLVKSTLATD